MPKFNMFTSVRSPTVGGQGAIFMPKTSLRRKTADGITVYPTLKEEIFYGRNHNYYT